TTPKFDEEEHVEAAQRDRLDGEESQGSMLAACWRRNCRQLGPERLGAGPRPLPSKIRLTVLGDTRRPSLSSSPAIRGSPQRGFSQRSAVRAGESDRRRADGRGFDAVASTCAARAPGASVEASVACPPASGAGALAADGRAPQATPDRLAAAAAGAAAGRTRPTDAAAPTTRRLWRTRCTDTWPAAGAQPNRRDRRRKGACAAALTA